MKMDKRKMVGGGGVGSSNEFTYNENNETYKLSTLENKTLNSNANNLNTNNSNKLQLVNTHNINAVYEQHYSTQSETWQDNVCLSSTNKQINKDKNAQTT